MADQSGFGLDLPAPIAYVVNMTALAQILDERLKIWDAVLAAEVQRLVSDIIAWADADALDLRRSRQRGQEVLDLLDEA